MISIPAAIRICLAILLLAGANLLPAQIGSNAPSFFARAWPVERGLPQNKVTAVLQTRDGYLWVGTYSGLARFDGVNFTVFDEKTTPAMNSSRVTALFESNNGTLWIGYENGSVTTFDDGIFRSERIPGDENDGKIYAITADENGDVWLFHESGLLARLRDGLILSPTAGSAVELVSLARDQAGKIWVARDGKLSVVQNAKVAATFTNYYVQGICAARDGGMWVASNGRVCKWDGGEWTQDLGDAPWAFAPLTSFVETKDGILLAGTADNGFFMMFPDRDAKPLHFNRSSGFQADWIISLLGDREGDIWVGTGGNGLVSLRPNNINTVSPPDHWHGRAVLSFYPGKDGGLWIGTEGAGLYHYADGRWENYENTNGVGNTYIWSIAEDSAGHLFAGSWGGGLYVRDGDHFKFAPGMENVLVRVPALFAARDGSLWAGTENAILHYQSGKTNWFADVDGRPLRDARAIAEDTNGVVWFGTAGYGLARLEQNKIRQFTRADGLSSDYIECLHFDENDALWIGTFGGGLCRFKNGKFSVIDSAQGLPNSVIGDIEDDGRGFFWMSSHGGITRAAKKELNDCADGRVKAVSFLNYGINDGLPTIECSEGLQPAGGKTPDGRLWFPTSKGLVVVNPNEARINPLPPPMVLENLVVDGQTVTNLASPLKIPAGCAHFEFHYTALSFVAPEKVRFKYRMEGLEKDWQDGHAMREATYNFLPPGEYVFHVIACNNDGLWNETGISLKFTLLPYFWQTWWFRFFGGLATVLAASGLVWLDARRRMHRRLENLERERAVERERTRIAQDIHDDLGSSLTRINMRSQSACRRADNPAETVKDLAYISSTARQLTQAMNEIVWAVDPHHDTLDSMVGYIGKLIQELLGGSGIRFRLDFPSQLPEWVVRAEVRHNLLLAFKEALHNVLKHSHATEVRISFLLQPSGFVVKVTDNGCGFNPIPFTAITLAGGPPRLRRSGLVNMRQRMEGIGGRCEIQSEAGRGTQVILSLLIMTTAK